MYKGDSPLTESRARRGRLAEGRGCRGETWWARRCEKGMGTELSFPPHLWYPGLDAGTGVIREERERRQAARRSPRPPASRRRVQKGCHRQAQETRGDPGQVGLEEKKGNSKKDGQQSPTLASKTRPGRRATVIIVILKSLVTLGEVVLVV